MTIADYIVKDCTDRTGRMQESVRMACARLFESSLSTEVDENELVPVDTGNVVNSEAAKSIPAQLTTAQATAKAVEDEQNKLNELKQTAEQQVDTLRDTLAIASQDQPEDPNAGTPA